MVTVCQTCGDEGFEEALMYCGSCEGYAIHRYCLDSVPVNFEDHITWVCVDCEQSNSGSDSTEIDQTAKLGLILKRNQKRKNPGLYEENKKERRSGSPEILTRSEDCRLENIAIVEQLEVCSASTNEIDEEFKRQRGLNSERSHEKAGSVRNEASAVPTNDPSSVSEHDFSASKESKLNSGSCDEESDSLKTTTPLGAINDHPDMPQLPCENRQLAAGNSCKEAEPNKTRTSSGLTDKCFDIPKFNGSIRAQPIIEPIWQGLLYVKHENFGSVDGLVAHLSSLACPRVCEAARSLPRRLSSELFPRLDIWPKSFLRSGGPNDISIGLYFFPLSQSENIFDALVEEMMRKDLALRTVLDNAELLFFTSYALPMQYWSKCKNLIQGTSTALVYHSCDSASQQR